MPAIGARFFETPDFQGFSFAFFILSLPLLAKKLLLIRDYDIKTDFFAPEAQDLLVLLEMDALRFQVIREDSGKAAERDLLIFERKIPLKFKKYTDSILPAKSFYASNEIDDCLLNHFEDLGILFRKHLIDSSDVYEYFSYYIIACHENSAVTEYVAWLRRENKDKDIYENFDRIYHLVRSMSK